MPELYIPPPGAMQFLLSKGLAAKDKPGVITAAEKQIAPIWVMVPGIQNVRPCECARLYPVIVESLTERNAAHMRRRLRERGRTQVYVCNCVGSLVE